MASLTLLTTALLAASSLALPQTTTPENPTVTIDNGVVIGTTTSIPDSETIVNQFLGIPFGANPIRFSAPEPAKPWDTPYDASRYQPSCLMQFNYPDAKRNRTIKTFATPGPPAGTSEDCLNLNIYAPAGSNAGSKPVAFWIHGGSFLHGSGSLPYYDGSKMAGHEDIIVVTINYRTNIFGFPTTYDLPEGKWNVGFLDQRLALKWVQDNIAAFGGDPKKVTIFGESAGAGSVDDLITAPPEPLPFRAAILQSGTANTNVTPTGAWEHAIKLAKCDKGKFDEVLKCMRIVPATELKDIIERAALEFKPISDIGATLANFPRDVRLQSRKTNNIMARVPIMLGSTADEARMEDFMNVTVEQALSAWLPNVTTEQANFLKMYYPIGSPGITNEFDRVVRIATELGMQCPIRYTAEDFHSTGINTWRFMYNASFPNTEIFKGSGAYHSSEIPTLFGTYPEEGSTDFQGKLSKAMQRAWGQFIRDPQRGPGWGQIPYIAVFGGGASPEKPGKVFEVSNSTLAEKRCIIFKDMWTKGKTEESLGAEN